ncbi:MAG: baseplate J/gp47 family protein [Oscillospiraceae bacterium]
MMLNVPQLDDLDYRALMERARAMIPTLTDEWTDLNDHDPGITTLQVFAWLCDGLNYYINATGEQHRLKYLKLLGIEPIASAAHCRVAVNVEDGESFYLPRGTRLMAGDVSFELTASCRGTGNRLVCLYAGKSDKLVDLTAFAGQDGEIATAFQNGKSDELMLGFTNELSETLRLYIEIDEAKRNPFNDDFKLTELKWEYFDGTEWQNAEIVFDETCSLLRSGYLTLKLKGAAALYKTEQIKSAYYLKAHIVNGEYDAPPRMGRVILNCADALQIKTYSEAAEFTYDGLGTLDIDRAIQDDDIITIAVKDGDEYISYNEHCKIETGAEPFSRKIIFSKKAFGIQPKQGARILVIVTKAGMEGELNLGITDGCAEQQFEFSADNVFVLRLALVQTDNKGVNRITLWDECDDLSKASCDSQMFTYNARTHTVSFGDGIHGLQPQQGQTVIAVTVKTSVLSAGNVLRGQLNTLDFPKQDNIKVYNIANATGGIQKQSSEELMPLIESKLKKATRTVTKQDICELVLETPGLQIDSVAVVPMREYCEAYDVQYKPNTIVVAVKPHTAKTRPQLSEVYRRRIREYLEPSRLLTTEINVVSAQYVGISVFGRIALTENNEQNKAKVKAKIEKLIDTVQTGEFGRGTDYGTLFSAIEMLPYVKSVLQLSLEYIGKGGTKNEHGDISLYPDSLSYLREIGIEFI